MATVVLTAVGTAIGGPIGGAIGSLLGQVIDREIIFRPKGREGPRLAELSVQTSTYGAPIPKLFGTMRIAGQVVWATDLKESRDTEGGGKGQPSTTTYSYSASFAVLLSARAIRGVRRIWADGKLLRGVAGDFKSRTGFRLHLGGEDQAADPLIASAEGVGQTPAMRGCAYAVFENLALADFGNRIPSLTFEVEADTGAIALGAIVEGVSGGAVRSDLALPVGGFSGYGDSVRGVIAPLAEIAGARFAERDGVLWATGGADAGEIAALGAAADGKRGGRLERDVAALETVPRRVTIAHYDAARDYQIGAQQAARGGPGRRDGRIELAAAVSAGGAKLLAEQVLARAMAARATRRVRVPWSPVVPEPGASVRVAGDAARWRVTGVAIERLVAEISLTRIAGGSAAALPATPGRVLGEVDAAAGASRIEAFELPPTGDAPLMQPRLHIAACGEGPGWRGAGILVRTEPDGGWAVAGRIRLASVMGTLESALSPAAAGLIDRRSMIEVALAHDGMMLADADDASLDAGANAALIGDELVQFARAEPLGGARWRISGLWRGRRGTEGAMDAQAAGTRFVLIDPAALLAVDLPPGTIGRTVDASASGVGDAEPAAASAGMSGRSVAPPAPVHARATALGDGGLLIGWTRRSRTGWAWRDGVDAPLSEEREAYRLTITRGDGSVRAIETANPGWTYPAAALADDRSMGPVGLTIAQIGTHAASVPLTMTI
jgi:hypothetical protein